MNNELIDNDTIIYYYDKNNIIHKFNENNTFFLINEYCNLHKTFQKYNKIPPYLSNKVEKKNIKCLLKNINDSYYNNIPFITLDNNRYILSELLRYNDYYSRLPIILINAEYISEFLDFLDNCPKYQKFKNLEIFKINLIKPYSKGFSQHYHQLNFMAEVIENIDFYSKERVNILIERIKKLTKTNYIQLINQFIINVFDILAEWILFFLNNEPLYYICPDCDNPLLFIQEKNNIRNESISNINVDDNNSDNFYKNNIINENQLNYEYDYSFYKSINIFNNIYRIIIQNSKSNFFNDYSNFINKKINMENKLKITANPPRINRYINIIYHDNNYSERKNGIDSDCDLFRQKVNGAFIFSNSRELFANIINHIKNTKGNSIIFNLIVNGNNFEEIYDVLYNEHSEISFINKICIFCYRKEKYLPLLSSERYREKLEGVYTTQNEIIHFIERNSSENTKIYESLKITYKHYNNIYYKVHENISKYYENFGIIKKYCYYSIAIAFVKDFYKNEKKDELYKGLQYFQTNKDYEIIKIYTKENSEKIYSDINSWLNNFNTLAYGKAAYFIGILMFKLNEYGEQRMHNQRITSILYRGIYFDYLNALSYKNVGEIIYFPAFTSTSNLIEKAEEFAKLNKTTPEKRKNQGKFSVIIKIYPHQDEHLWPLCFDIRSISYYNTENEFLFHPFSFFKIRNFKINFDEYRIDLELDTIGKREILEPKIRKRKRLIVDRDNNIITIRNNNNNAQNIGQNRNNFGHNNMCADCAIF